MAVHPRCTPSPRVLSRKAALSASLKSSTRATRSWQFLHTSRCSSNCLKAGSSNLPTLYSSTTSSFGHVEFNTSFLPHPRAYRTAPVRARPLGPQRGFCAGSPIATRRHIYRGVPRPSRFQSNVVSRSESFSSFFTAFGRRVRTIREDRQWRQEDMMEHGISLRHWQRIESGHRINVVTLLKIAKAFGYTPEALIAGLTEASHDVFRPAGAKRKKNLG